MIAGHDRVEPPYAHKGCGGLPKFVDDHAVCPECRTVWIFTRPGSGGRPGWAPR